jgi:hypothetical protein
MKRFWICAAAALLLTGCGDTDGGAGSAVTVESCVGTWKQELSDGTETLTLKSDMTYDKVIKLGGASPVEKSTHDDWALSGNTISISYSSYGTVSDYTVSFEGGQMIWKDRDSTQTWKKIS